jgi:cytochrome c oxidase cbb3-type subunit 3
MRILCAALPCAALLLLACDRPPSDDEIKTWTPSDHDRAEENQRVASGAQATPQAAGGDNRADNNRQLVELTWRQQCATCHGALGHGDGPNGPMVKAADLTKDEWQTATTDEQIVQSIRNGKGRMPKFDLPPAVLAGIVQRIRASRGR